MYFGYKYTRYQIIIFIDNINNLVGEYIFYEFIHKFHYI